LGHGVKSRAAFAVLVVLVLVAAAWLSLWVGTPRAYGPFEAVGAMFSGDVALRTLVRSRGLEILLLALGGAVQAAVVPLVRARVGVEAPSAFGASGAGLAATFGVALPIEAACGAASGALGALVSRLGGDARRIAALVLAPALYLVWTLGTTAGESRVWIDVSRRVFGDVAGANGGDLALAAAALLVALAALLVHDARVRAVLGALAAGASAAAVGWFGGLGFLAARAGAGAGAALVLGATLAVSGECALAAASEPGRLPVAAATGLAALLVALLPLDRRV
jgi:hypothetical protein